MLVGCWSPVMTVLGWWIKCRVPNEMARGPTSTWHHDSQAPQIAYPAPKAQVLFTFRPFVISSMAIATSYARRISQVMSLMLTSSPAFSS